MRDCRPDGRSLFQLQVKIGTKSGSRTQESQSGYDMRLDSSWQIVSRKAGSGTNGWLCYALDRIQALRSGLDIQQCFEFIMLNAIQVYTNSKR